jgi:hypothetical protein
MWLFLLELMWSVVIKSRRIRCVEYVARMERGDFDGKT